MSNSNYIRLQELVFNTINLDAPVDLEKGALLLETNSRTVLLQFRLNVLVNHNEISSISLNIYGFTDSGEKVEGFSPFLHTYLDVYLQGSKTFGDKTPIILDPRIRKVTATIDKVVFRSGVVWRNNGGDFQSPVQKPISSIKADLLPQFKREISNLPETDKARFVYIPLQLENFWLCTCGRPNKNGDEICRRCGLQRHGVFQVTNVDYLQHNLQRHIEETRIAEERRLRAEEETKNLAARKKRQLGLALITLLAVGSLLAVFFFVVQPAIKYSQATSLLNNKDFDGATSTFTALGNYIDTSDTAKESTYQKGVDLLANKLFDESISAFTSLGDYRDSFQQLLEAKYLFALDKIAKKDEVGAIKILEQMLDYKDSKERLGSIKFNKARLYYNNAEFASAKLIFQEIPDYQNSKSYLNNIDILISIQGTWEEEVDGLEWYGFKGWTYYWSNKSRDGWLKANFFHRNITSEGLSISSTIIGTRIQFDYDKQTFIVDKGTDIKTFTKISEELEPK